MKVQVKGVERDNPTIWSDGILNLSDGQFNCFAFTYPCTAQVNDWLKEPLSAFDCTHIVRVTPGKVGFLENEKPFGYFVIGIVDSVEESIIRVGHFSIEIDDLPGDIIVGDWVSFCCGRLDFMG